MSAQRSWSLLRGLPWLLALFGFQGTARADLRGTTELEARLYRDLRARQSARWSLADMFLISSGFRDQRALETARSKLQELIAAAREEIGRRGSPYRRGDRLLRWLHERAFSGYHPQATDARALLQGGSYNCLSSCILYGIVGDALGLRVKGVAVERHAFCRLYGARGGVDVETTTAYGFDPGRDIQIDRAVVRVPRSQYRGRQEISLKEMIGLIHSNHLALLNAFPSTEDKLLALRKGLLFFPRSQALRDNVRAAFLMAIEEARRAQQWERGFAFAEQAMEFEPRESGWARGLAALIQFWLQGIEQRGDFSTGHVGLEQLRGRFPRFPWPLFEGLLEAQFSRALFLQGDEAGSEAHFRAAIRSPSVNARQARPLPPRILTQLSDNREGAIENVVIEALNRGRLPFAQRLAVAAALAHPRSRRFGDRRRMVEARALEGQARAALQAALERDDLRAAERALRQLRRSYPNDQELRRFEAQLRQARRRGAGRRRGQGRSNRRR